MIKNNKYIFCIVTIFNVPLWVSSVHSASAQQDMCRDIEILLPYQSQLLGLYKEYDVEGLVGQTLLEENVYNKSDNNVISAEELRREIRDAVRSYYQEKSPSFWSKKEMQTLLWLFTSSDMSARLALQQRGVLLSEKDLAEKLRPD